jgi:hypothetical protein
MVANDIMRNAIVNERSPADHALELMVSPAEFALPEANSLLAM